MKALNYLLSIVTVSLVSVSASQATTEPATPFTFTPAAATDNFSVRASGWGDPKFGDLGWVHSSDWGFFQAKKGQLVTITMTSKTAGLHPGSTIFYRGADDTARDTYIPDVALTQTGDLKKYGAVDDATGAPVGDIVMKYVTNAYDADKNAAKPTNKKIIAKKDGIPGKLIVQFKAPYEGKYMFVTGGFSPSPTVNTKIAYSVKVNVNVR